MRGLLNIHIGEHISATFLGTWIAGSYLRAALLTEPSSASMAEPKIKLGALELNVALALLNILFFTFVAVQTQYLFGNAATVETTPGLTYSSYARRGFFELVAVALLVLPILLGADRRHAPEKSKRPLRLQSLILVALVGCVIVSAMHRMRLYQNEYGLTELRWYTMAFMIWLAFLFALFCVTVLRDRRPVFVAGILASGFTMILIIHALNPDQRIAASQFANAKAGRRFDPEYFRKLSADAVPIVTANAHLLPAHDREVYLEEKRAQLTKASDFRSWNYSRHAARNALIEGAK
jgi:hypothetical protein